MTWWHADDWAGRIQEAMNADDGADKFEIIKYPAINDLGDEYILPDDTIEQFADNTVPPPIGSRLTRRMNTAVHPQRYTTEMMLKIKNNLVGGGQKRVWDALYQQNPIPDEGNYFSKEMFRYYGSKPDVRDLYIYQAWDFAISEGKESDYTVGTCIGVDHRDNVYVLDVRRFRSQDAFLIIDSIIDFAQEHNATMLGFEDGQIWKALDSQFQKRCDERRYFPAFEVLKPLTDKMVRANPLRGRMQLGKVFFDKTAAYFTEMFKELLHFPAGKHDDQVDSLAWAIRLTLSRVAPKQKTYEPKLKSWKDKLPGFTQGVGASHMCA
jgi:predicted phage terminase large subunit-like protein